MEDRLEIWLELIGGKLDRLIEIGESLEGQLRLPAEKESQTFADAKEPAKSLAELTCEPVEPILPKVGDWVKVTRPQNWEECADPCWSPDMHRFDGRVGQIEAEWAGRFELRGFANSRGIRVHFHRDWLQAGWSCPSPVRPPAIEEAPKPEHPAGPMPDPGEGYRLLSKDPPEELQPGDDFFGDWDGGWHQCIDVLQGICEQKEDRWYRRKIDPAKEPEPAWEPKVGDWVLVTRPENWEKCWSPCWLAEMHQFDGKVGCIERSQRSDFIRIRGFVGSDGLQYGFHRDWLSPSEPPEPAEPEYREPVLPADAGKKCQFSDDGQRWVCGWVYGWVPGRNWVTLHNNSWKHARIKKDA